MCKSFALSTVGAMVLARNNSDWLSGVSLQSSYSHFLLLETTLSFVNCKKHYSVWK